ncbi:MAG: 4-(cytidine 5'-diphospho)-2-C-methyl-D-erythritol kinase [Gemmatimonadota bacterium]
MTEVVTMAAAAKVNLLLRVLALESDGFHGIETVFCRLDLADTVTVERTASGIALEVEGADLGPPEENLAYRAAQAVLRAVRGEFGVRIKLMKKIPVQGGLGGGSSDAAAVLEGVNQLAGNVVPRHELFHYGARLGSDVPFLLSGAPLALGWGHGERLLRLPALPAAAVLLLTPPVGISTLDAYRWLDQGRVGAAPRGALALDLDALSRWSDVARMAGNDFESHVFGKVPAVRAAFEALANTSPMLCRMSGSGSTVFAVYRDERGRDDAKMMLGKKHGSVIATRTA